MTGVSPGRTPVAAFFDVDGTIIVPPSLERSFLRKLRHRRAIPRKNYLLWLMHAARLAPRGIAQITHANKMYLRGIISTGTLVYSPEADTSTVRLRSPQPLVPAFFPKAVERIAWHAAQEHSVVLVTGTLAPLAREIALALALRVAIRGIPASIGVCATRLEEADGRWTGRIIGDPIFGQAKARVVRHLAAKAGLDLARCYAYGDSANDRWMLGAVGKPVAVNPSRELERITRLLDWPVLWWKKNADESGHKTGYAAMTGTKTETLG